MTIEAAFFGTLGRDGELKTSTNGKPYLRLNVRTDDGDAALWVSVMAFDPEAIGMAGRFTKGARVYVEGKLSQTEWTGADGARRHGLSCLAWHCRLSQIGRNRPKRPRDDTRQRQRDDKPANRGFYNDDLPF
jgi:single-stranded DNA-binding protein